MRFSSRVSFEFPASEVHEVALPAVQGEPARMTVNVLGLAGALGPLPAPFSELLLERVWAKDPAFRDFLDIFNHRLISMLHRARKRVRARPLLGAPGRRRIRARRLRPDGAGHRGTRGAWRSATAPCSQYTGCSPGRALGHVAGDDARRLLRGGRALPPFVGRWLTLDDEQRTALGWTGRHRSSRGSGRRRSGGRVWDQAPAPELTVGPLTLGQFLDFLPWHASARSSSSSCALPSART